MDNIINIADYTYSKYNIAPDELKTLPPVFIAHCNGDYDVPVEEVDIILIMFYLHFELLNKVKVINLIVDLMTKQSLFIVKLFIFSTL